mmetsp:Transcript_102432/g.267346  ORF Transcript_102432/g.267346 Transcript_102432/m.267346 type:complete len:228 (+) Transcript_102432:319-1002(+)
MPCDSRADCSHRLLDACILHLDVHGRQVGLEVSRLSGSLKHQATLDYQTKPIHVQEKQNTKRKIEEAPAVNASGPRLGDALDPCATHEVDGKYIDPQPHEGCDEPEIGHGYQVVPIRVDDGLRRVDEHVRGPVQHYHKAADPHVVQQVRERDEVARYRVVQQHLPEIRQPPVEEQHGDLAERVPDCCEVEAPQVFGDLLEGEAARPAEARLPSPAQHPRGPGLVLEQ